MTKTILLDCDGVLCDFIGAVCAEIRFFGGGDFTPDHVTEFDFCKSLGLDATVASEVKKMIGHHEGWWLNLEPLPGAIEGVAALREVAEVYIVTSPWNSCRTWLHDREAWLKRHFGIPHSHVIACSAKHLVAGDMLVDDKTEALVKWDARWSVPTWAGVESKTFAVQWQTPHNRLDGWTGRSTRSWEQLRAWATGWRYSPRPARTGRERAVHRGGAVSFCALCIRDIVGTPQQAPLGRGNALVNVCDDCHDEHPRSGKVGTFGEATRRAGNGPGGDGVRHARPRPGQ